MSSKVLAGRSACLTTVVITADRLRRRIGAATTAAIRITLTRRVQLCAGYNYAPLYGTYGGSYDGRWSYREAASSTGHFNVLGPLAV